MQPSVKPANPNFSSGPCSKRPGYSVNQLVIDTLGRSHRSALGKKALEAACVETAELLGLPEGYRVGVVPWLWTRVRWRWPCGHYSAPVRWMLAWESFGSGWSSDIMQELKIKDVRKFVADYGTLPDLSAVNFHHDVVFTFGTAFTSGVKVPNGDWIAADRQGLTICDATSAVFAMDMPWEKLDVVTFSWQKC